MISVGESGGYLPPLRRIILLIIEQIQVFHLPLIGHL